MMTSAAERSVVMPDVPRDKPPLAVDLDGTLIKSDSLHEGCLSCLKGEPRKLLQLATALRRGKAAFKREVAGLAAFDPSLLPYNTELLEFVKAERQAGRRIGLFTAADQSTADRIAAYLDLFDVVQGSDGRTNLSAHAKAAAIQGAFGPRFTYAGDAPVDRPIFAAAESVILVGAVDRLRAALPQGKPVETVFPTERATARVWVTALRLPHWVKNSLVFVAPIIGLRFLTPQIALQTLMLFLLMGVFASATYLINDLLDLAADRQHPKKRSRPFAAGAISARTGVVVAVLMIFGAAIVGTLLPAKALASLFAYLVITLCYSLFLKRLPMIDVVVLAALFTIRVAAGGFLLPTPTSPWLLTFSMLFFLGLAMIKRYAELERVLRADSETGQARGYTGRDLPILLATGVASGISAVVIFTIYLINEQYPQQFYHHPGALWCIMPILLIWTLRVWHLSVHGQMNEDPVVFALKDRFSLALGLVVLLILLVAWI
jgi:4-hydroxybenzoate polyprenyltransferase/phosphoserine phosphatase